MHVFGIAVGDDSLHGRGSRRGVTSPARRIAPLLIPMLFLLLLVPTPSATIAAQGVTTAGVRGTVRAGAAGQADAWVRVVHEATGFSVEVRAAGGRFVLQGLEPGGPYTIITRSLGFAPERREGVLLALGELLEINVALQPIAPTLAPVTVAAQPASGRRALDADGGIGTTIPVSLLEHLPAANRDLYDFVRLVPQISTKINLPNPALSAGGMGFRFNNFVVNGVSDRTLSGGVSSAFAGVRSVPLDAIQEYQVLLAPYDVRYGDFAGAFVNAVTKSGTNTLHGSVFAYGRNDRFARHVDAEARVPYERVQYGLSLGGPIVRDRVHFFAASELQHFTFPAAGPYVGQPSSAERGVPVSSEYLEQFDAIMRTHGLTPGSPGPVRNGSPLRNLFTRLDAHLPAWRTRAFVWSNYSGSDDAGFSRAARDTFSLSSYQVTRAALWRTNALQFHTALPRTGGGHNELLVSRRSETLEPGSGVQQPIVRVSVPAVSGNRVTLNSGTHESAQGIRIASSAVAIRNNLTLPLGMSHLVTLGVEAERFRIRRRGAAGSFGTWSFGTLNDLELGIANRYDVRFDFGSAATPLSGTQYAAYAGDHWQAGDRLSLTAGLRADLLAIDGHAPYHAGVDAAFGRRTDDMPRQRVEISPRVGFVWDPVGSQRQHLRGGLGIFTGRYPLGWAHAALSAYGVGGVLRCSRLNPDLQPPPAFNPDPRTPPTACRDGVNMTPANPGDVNLLDGDLRMMRVVRGSVGYDSRLPWDLTFRADALVTRALSDFVMVNLNLADPEATDRVGRVMYGTFSTGGVGEPTTRSAFSEVIDLRNIAGNSAWQLSTSLEKGTATGARGTVSYTFTRSRDVQSLVRINTRGTVAWASARATSGRHDDMSTGISSNDVPHRVVIAGTYTAPWSRATTELSFHYVGESGRPFTYIASGTSQRGDLNADGSNANDPIYVPRDARDPLDMRFSGLSPVSGADNSPAAQGQREALQRDAFESFVSRSSCLRRQRGRIVERNSCREPWSNTTVASLRQAIPAAKGAVELQVDVFNVLNLLHRDWGQIREAAPVLLEHAGQTAGSVGMSEPIFRFAADTRQWSPLVSESSFQLQLALRYRF